MVITPGDERITEEEVLKRAWIHIRDNLKAALYGYKQVVPETVTDHWDSSYGDYAELFSQYITEANQKIGEFTTR